MDTFWQDLRYGMRMLMKHPGFTAVAVVTLALGIGANTAIFSVVNAVLLRPLPYAEPDRLMKVVQRNTAPGKSSMSALWAYRRFEVLRDHSQSLAGVAAYAERAYNLTGVDEPERLQVEFVSATYCQTLVIPAVVGRTFTAQEDKPHASPPTALISHGLWQRRFGADPKIIGRTIELDKQPLAVVGVLPAGFKGQSGTVDVWLPMGAVPVLMSPVMLTNPRSYWVQVIARLKPGVTLEQAQTEMNSLTEQIEKLYPGPTQSRPSGAGEEVITLVPLKEAQLNPVFRQSFLLLFAVVGIVLLIVCTNIAGLLLARTAGRQKECAVRLALGASRSRLVQQLLTESVLLSLSGGSLGILVALWGIDLLNEFKPTDAGQFWTSYAQTFRFFTIRLDGWVLAFNFLLAMVTGILFGLTPAWQASRPDLNRALKDSAGSLTAAWRGMGHSVWRLLVISQIALALVLLAGAGLMIRSLVNLLAVDLGFDPTNVITMQVYARDATLEFYRQLHERAAALPGVESVSVAGTAPLSGYSAMSSLEVEGRETTAAIHTVSPDYFRTLRIPLLGGRVFTEQDRIGAKRVAILNRTAAHRFFPGADPVGKLIRVHLAADYPKAEPLLEIVGIVGDVKYGRIEEVSRPEIYLSAWQPVAHPATLIIRARVDPTTLVSAVRREVRLLDPNLPLHGIETMAERVAEVTSRTRFLALMLGLFAGLALILSAIGIYGVIAHAVSARVKEIGIRMALGAESRAVLWLVLQNGIRLTFVGLALGLIASLAATRVLSSQLYGVSAIDATTFVMIALLLSVVALVASYLPARRATRVDPMVALRYE